MALEKYTARLLAEFGDQLKRELGNIQRAIAFPSWVREMLSASEAEGSWTPGLSFGGGTTGITYTTQVGTYLKLGNTVIANGYLLLSNNGTATGAALVTGLPFTVANTAGQYSAAALRVNRVTYANYPQAYANINTTTVVLEEITEAGTVTALADTDFANDSDVMVSVTYRAA